MTITAIAVREQVNFVLLFSGLVLGSAVFTMFGLVVGTISKSLNHYFVIGVPVGIFLMLPAFFPLIKINHFLIEIMPSTLILRVINGSLGLSVPYPLLISIAGLILWCPLVFFIANNVFNRYLRNLRS